LSELAKSSADHLCDNLKTFLPENATTITDVFCNNDLLITAFNNTTTKTAYGRCRTVEKYKSSVQVQTVKVGPIPNCPKASQLKIISPADVVYRELLKHNWDPDQNGGFPNEMDYIGNMR
jgi:hypothetical protein